MSLQLQESEPKKAVTPPDASTRTLSVASVETDFVEEVYEKIASVYDFTFGPTLHAGRVESIGRLGISPGDRVLEVGVGTGINACLSARLHVTASTCRRRCSRRRSCASPGAGGPTSG